MLLDARTKEKFEGTHVREARAGHIPSAININWEENIQGGSFKTKEELAKVYSKIDKDFKVVTYCQGGYRAANSFLALKRLRPQRCKNVFGIVGRMGKQNRFTD